MLRKVLRILSVGALLCALPFAPHGARAQLGPPPGPLPPPPVGGFAGKPPGPGFGAPPLRAPVALPPHIGARGAGLAASRGLHGFDRGAMAAARGVEGRAAAYDYGRAADRYGYGREWRQWARYGTYAAAGGSYAYADYDDCYYVTAYRRHAYRRVLICR